MITTVIPFLLLANVPDSPNWEHGPQFKFKSEVTVVVDGLHKDTVTQALNVTNYLTCQPKDGNVLTCDFDHEDMTMVETNKVTGETTQHPIPDTHPDHEAERFEIKFNKMGIESLTVPTPDSPDDFRVLIFKSVANLLNTGMDLSMHQSDEKYDAEQVIDFLLGKCKADVKVDYVPSDNSKNFNMELNLVDPLTKVSNDKHFSLEKTVKQVSDCMKYTHFYWAGILMEDLHDDPELKLVSYKDHMNIYDKAFESGNEVHLERKVNDDALKIDEKVVSHLVEISAAKESAPTLENPMTVEV